MYLDMMVYELTPGDVVIDRLEVNPPATVLRWAEWKRDQFGRMMMNFWARREDTGQEGYLIYGPEGVVRVERNA